MSDSQGHRAEGRPYRSHLHPACFSCKKRKSRCRTQNASTICIMCQVHGTECIFPSPDSIHHCQGLASPRKSNVNLRRRVARGRHSQLSAREKAGPRHMHIAGLENNDTPQNEQESGALPSIVGMVAGAGDDNPHIVSPAVAEDNRFLENYLSALPTAQETCFSRTRPESDRSFRPVRFNLVPRRPLGVCASQTLAAAKCEVIEKYMGPNMEEYLDLSVSTGPCLGSSFQLTDAIPIGSFKEQMYASQSLTKLHSEVHILFRGTNSRLLYCVIYMPTPWSIGKHLPLYQRTILPTCVSSGIKPTRPCIQSCSYPRGYPR